MRIGLNHIDPQIAAAMKERLCAPLPQFLKDDIRWARGNKYLFDFESSANKRKREPAADEKSAFSMRKKREERANRRGMTATFAPIALGAGLGFALNATGVGIGWMIGAGVWGVMTGAGLLWAQQASPERFLRYEVSLEEMRAVFRLLTLSRAERVYCDILLFIANMEANQEARHTIRETMNQLNHLLEDSRKLEKRRRGLLSVMGSHVAVELEREQQSLRQRIEAATDRVTRESMEQSLQMVSTRLENALTLEQALVRLNAQQEALVHAFSSTQSALARMQVAPSAATDQAAEEITQTVEQMNQQTRSVEKAVEEVMTLRLS